MKIYDSATQKYKIVGKTKNTIKIFICGPTIYDSLHLGHARVFLIYDALIRFLSFHNIKSKMIVNVTDIDWKIERRADRLKIPVKDITDYYFEQFLNDIQLMDLTDKMIFAKVSDYLETSVAIVKKTMDNNKSYSKGGNVYLNNNSVKKNYFSSKLQNQEFDISNAKKKSQDILLWNSSDIFGQFHYSTRDLPSGIPWWHLQDVSVIMYFFGGQYDIHGGAKELISPHHKSILSILQQLTNKSSPVGVWMHSGLLRYKNEKMSKSGNNVIKISDFLKKYNSNTLKLYIYSKNYKENFDFSETELKKYKIIEKKVRTLLELYENEHTGIRKEDKRQLMHKFVESLENDFDTVTALKVLIEALKENNINILKKMSEIFGLKY